MSTALLFGLAGVALFGLGLYYLVAGVDLVRRVLALNVMSTSLGAMLVAMAYEGPATPPDPVPHALALTGIVVTVSATALALALVRRLYDAGEDGDV